MFLRTARILTVRSFVRMGGISARLGRSSTRSCMSGALSSKHSKVHSFGAYSGSSLTREMRFQHA
ncbi:hypothetical protein K438DRAFT_1870829 [Mycena galopus ATCC 62051]|nr:hypothetical protein K438DRAFT_1870829 [Mycena galopus ATCC 62051]